MGQGVCTSFLSPRNKTLSLFRCGRGFVFLQAIARLFGSRDTRRGCRGRVLLAHRLEFDQKGVVGLGNWWDRLRCQFDSPSGFLVPSSLGERSSWEWVGVLNFLSYESLLILTGFVGIFLAWRGERGSCHFSSVLQSRQLT